MDKEIIVYLIFLAIMLLSRVLKKKPEKKAPAPQQSSRPKPRPKSFEELLEEITSGKKEEPVAPDPRPVTDRNKPEKRSRQEKLADRHSGAPAYAERAQNKELKTIDELVDINKVQTRTKLAETLEEEEERLDIRGMLNNPEDIRKAVILSEILPRKY